MNRRKSQCFFVLASVVLFLGFCAGASAQNITGEIDGVVRDASGAVIAGAKVEVINIDTRQVVRTLTTNKSGEYSASELQVGTYNLSAAAPGFQTNTLQGITLNVSDTLTEDVKLVAGSSETITVTTDTDKPNLETSENSSIINSTEMKELALNTRNFEQLLLLQPGVSYAGPDELNTGQVDPTGQSNSHGLSVNGLQPSQVVFQLDGADMLNHSRGGQVTTFPSINAIQQIQTVRNSYGAQYGGGGSAQIIIVTKAGGADFHGDAYFLYRNAGLNATPFFDLLHVPQESKPDIHYNIYGYSVGGPLFIPKIYPRDKSKTFFFFSQEFHRLVNYYDNDNNFFPNTPEMAGYFAVPVCISYAPPVGAAAPVCLAVSQKLTNPPYAAYPYQVPTIDPTAQEYLKDIIMPSVAQSPGNNDPLNANNVDFLQPSSTTETQELVRIDHQFSERLNGFFRYLFDPLHQNVPNGYNIGGHGYPGVGNSYIYTYGEDILGHITWTAGPNTVVEGGLSYSPYQIKATPYGLITQANSPDIHVTEPYVNTTGRVPTIAVLGGAFTSVGPLRDLSHTLQAFENTTWSLGRHVLYFGVNYERYTESVNQGTANAGQFNFNANSGAINLGKGVACTPAGTAKACNTSQFPQGFANFLIGYPTNFTQSSVDPIATPQADLYEAYVQDNWKITATLTLNAGVRWSVNTAPTDALNHLGGFQPQAYNPAHAPAIGTDGTICTNTTSDPYCAATTPNPAYDPFNGEVENNQNSAYGAALNRTPLLNFAPRVGFAWNVYGDGKTSLRGGYGIFFNQTNLQAYSNDTFNNGEYVQTPIYYAPLVFGNPGQGTSPGGQTQLIDGIERNFHQPYTQSYSIGVQQQVSKAALLDVSYVGNMTQHLQGEEDLNQPLPGQYLSSGIIFPVGTQITANNGTPQLNQIRPYLGYGPITYTSSRFFADYNGLQSSLLYRAGKKVTMGINYTWSRAMSNSPGPPINGAYNGPQNRFDLGPEWGPTVLDKRNIFVSHFVYELPSHSAWHGFEGQALNGWEVSGIIQLTSGTWNTIEENVSDPAGQGGLAPNSIAQPRPDQVSDPNNHAPHTQLNWIRNLYAPGTANALANPSETIDFAEVPASQYGRPGSARIGSVEGPSYASYNLDLYKNFELPETMRLQLRAEVFNVLNHVNFHNFGVVLNNANFGQITSAYDNRTIQVGAKLIF